MSAETLAGTARATKAGAVLVVGDGRVVLIPELFGWPEAVDGQAVVVTGVVGSESLVPEAVQTADGAWSQGKTGGAADLVIRQARWQLAASKHAADAGVLEPAPWALDYSDGSNNRTQLWMEGDAIAWRYDPVQPRDSSSGFYSGGVPGKGEATVEAATAVWIKLRHLETTAASGPDGTRRMGTGRVMVTTSAGNRTVVAERSDQLADFESALRATRQ